MTNFDAELRDANVQALGNGHLYITGKLYGVRYGHADGTAFRSKRLLDYDPESQIARTVDGRFKLTFAPAYSVTGPAFIVQQLAAVENLFRARQGRAVDHILAYAESLDAETKAMLAWKLLDLAGIQVVLAIDADEELTRRREDGLPPVDRDTMISAARAVAEQDWSSSFEALRHHLDLRLQERVGEPALA